MPSILSKLFPSYGSVTYNCYETLHPWTPSCSDASLGLCMSFFEHSFKVHLAMYLFNQLAIRRQYSADAFMKTLKCCFQSSSFMGLIPLVTVTTFCTIRKMSDRFYFYRQLLIPTLLGALCGTSCDFPARRETVTVFSLQIVTEIIYRTMVEEGTIKPINGGSTAIFVASSMLAMYIYTKYPDKDRGIIGTIINYVTGYQENKLSAKNNFKNLKLNIPADAKEQKMKVCDHVEDDCIKNVAKGSAVTFGSVALLQVLISSLSNPKKVSFARIMELISSARVLKMSLFASSYVAIYRTASCTMNKYFLRGLYPNNNNSNSDLLNGVKLVDLLNESDEAGKIQKTRDRIKIISSGLASLSMLINPSSSITLYFFWKSIHSYLSIELFKGDRSLIDTFNFVLETFLVAHILYTGFFNVGNMRPSYVNFMNNMSEGRLDQLNRAPLVLFGVKEYKQHLVPELDINHCSEGYITDYLSKK